MEFKYFVSCKFKENSKGYCFGCNFELEAGDLVVVDNATGLEIATVASPSTPIEKYSSNFELKEVLRKANKDDLLLYEANKRKAVIALKTTQEQVDKLKLDMTLLDANYVLDGSKITITYVADNRVDFRELLKLLAPLLKCRIELRQIGARDRARATGGIGMCGLPLCCNQFLKEFDGISINKAKNQMLALNISKLSGHCGKLICCLNFEDEAYTELKKEFPRIGLIVHLEDEEFKITGYNVISKEVKLENEETITFAPLEKVKELLKHEKRS